MILAGREVTAIFTFDQWPAQARCPPVSPGQLLPLSVFPNSAAQTRALWAPTFAAQRARTRLILPDARTVILKMLSSPPLLLSSDKWSDLDKKA